MITKSPKMLGASDRVTIWVDRSRKIRLASWSILLRMADIKIFSAWLSARLLGTART